MTALVSEPVYITSPIAEPDAKTVLDQRTFSAVSGSTLGIDCNGTSSDDVVGGGGLFMVNVPTKE